MAQLVGTAGAMLGSYFGGPIGGMLGSMAGAAIDRALFPAEAQKQVGPQLGELTVQNASYGVPIARTWGKWRSPAT
jgi:hypothetical protein